MEAIRVEALRRAFGEVEALVGLDFHVAAGEIYGLVGPDGAGKTTALRILAGILRPGAGTARVDGLDIADAAEAVKGRIGYMSQRFGLYPDLTVEENLRFYADIHLVPRRGLRERMAELLASSHLEPFRRRLAGNLSGGMKQKLGLSCALVHSPRILLLDEPTNGVDPVSRRDFWRILTRLNRDGVSILLSTAYLDEAERCHRVGLVHGGRIVAEGTPAELRKLVPGKMLEIRATDPRRAAAVLRERLPELSTDLMGDRVRIVAADEDRDAERARAALADAGLEVREIRRVEPSLENVFVALLGDGREAHARS